MIISSEMILRAVSVKQTLAEFARTTQTLKLVQKQGLPETDLPSYLRVVADLSAQRQAQQTKIMALGFPDTSSN